MPRVAWHNAKGISSIRQCSTEKTSKMYQNMSTFYSMCKIAISEYVLDVFSAPQCRIELIPFALCQATHRHKFRVLTRPVLKRKFFNFILHFPMVRIKTCWTYLRQKCTNDTPYRPRARFRTTWKVQTTGTPTSLDYPQQVFWRQIFFNYSAPVPLLGEPEKNYFGEKNTFLMDLIVLVTHWDTC